MRQSIWRCLSAGLLLAVVSLSPVPLTWAGDGNRLAYLDGSDPYYVSGEFPKLITPQWVGEEGVEAVVVLAIDDMRGYEKWETFLRPIIDRLKQSCGRAPLSIMTCQIDPQEAHLQKWLAEGLSLEVHTIDHPCPLLQGGDFAKAKSSYDRCVDQLDAIGHNHAVAFRMPCCDSLNTLSPRFFAEIFNSTTPAGNFLSIDSSVFNLLTAADPALPRTLVLDDEGQERFRRYVPFPSFANTIENYPYPYPIGRLCWELPCVVPTDWSAFHVQQSGNPRTVRDLEAALDAVVVKQGVYDLVFHPHGWIRSEQINEIVDHAIAHHGRKIKFLNFRELLERLNKNLLAGQSLRAADGGDNGVRLVDLNADGYLDVVIGNDTLRQTRIWQPKEQRWTTGDFPLALVTFDRGQRRDAGARFGILHADGYPSLIVRGEQTADIWHFDGQQWAQADISLADLHVDGQPIFTTRAGIDQGVRLRDLDGDGRTEWIVAGPGGNAVFQFLPQEHRWKRLPFGFPEGARIVDENGHDAGLRFVDIDEDGHDDLIFSNEQAYGVYLFESLATGWSKQVLAGRRGEGDALPLVVRQGANNGAWFHSRHLWVQNEDTNRLPDLIDRRSYGELLKDVMPGPKTPAASLKALRARPGFKVELMAAEPLVLDPIALAWGPDAKLWVVEMGDYPLGTDGQGKPGGVVRFLEDTNGDGRYDKSTVFLDGLGFPTGVAPCAGGVLVACAPDIFYAEDTDGDGRADKREVLYTGFGQGNQQHRMNGLKWGLDGWLYCANGDSGGRVKSLQTGQEIDLGGRDFRIRPDEGLIDPQLGVSQYGRNRDDWDNWFGCNNSNPMWHFVLSDQYLRRNPHVAAPDSRVPVSVTPGPAAIFPQSRTLTRFNDPGGANRFSSANSAMVYRDELFGPAFTDNVFISEPVHNLVHREIMQPSGLTFTSHRAEDEQTSEFLASSDNWFRPTMLATGPDGALWVADMYRLVIEHPQWIPKEWQEKLDLRAGADQGRIYRVLPVGAKPRPIPRLDKLPLAQLAAAIDSPSGWQRDMVQQMLLWRGDKSAAAQLKKIATGSPRRKPASRPCVRWTAWRRSIRRHCWPHWATSIPACDDMPCGWPKPAWPARPKWPRPCWPWLTTPIRKSNCKSLTRSASGPNARAAAALARMAANHQSDRFLRAAVLSSTNAGNIQPVLTAILTGQGENAPDQQFVEQLVAVATALGDKALPAAVAAIAKGKGGKFDCWQLAALAGLLDALQCRKTTLADVNIDPKALAPILQFARITAANADAPIEDRLAAVRLLVPATADPQADIKLLAGLLTPQTHGDVQSAAVEALARVDHAQATAALVSGWKGYGPALKSKILDVLLSRDSSTRAAGGHRRAPLPPGDVDAAHRQR